MRIEILAGTIVGASFLTRNRWRVAPISEPKIFDLKAELGTRRKLDSPLHIHESAERASWREVTSVNGGGIAWEGGGV